MNKLIIDAAGENIFFVLINNKDIYNITHSNSKTNYEKLTILINEFINFVATIPAAYPELVSSDQISLFFQAVSSELTSITQNIVKTSISGIQSTITFLIYVILFPILVYFFFFDRKNITNS